MGVDAQLDGGLDGKYIASRKAYPRASLMADFYLQGISAVREIAMGNEIV